MDAKKVLVSGLAAGVAIFVASFVVDSLISFVWPYNVFELGGMRSMEDPLMMLFFASPFVIGLAVAVLYDFTKQAFSGTAVQKGLRLGLLVWLVGSVPSAFIVFTSMTYPIGFTVSSVVTTLLYMIAGGIVIAKLGG